MVLKSLLDGCLFLQKNKCKFIAIPCNTAHHWCKDLNKKLRIPIISMPNEVFNYTKKNCSYKSKIGILATESTLKTRIYHEIFEKKYSLIIPTKVLQTNCVNKKLAFFKQIIASNKMLSNDYTIITSKQPQHYFKREKTSTNNFLKKKFVEIGHATEI